MAMGAGTSSTALVVSAAGLGLSAAAAPAWLPPPSEAPPPTFESVTNPLDDAPTAVVGRQGVVERFEQLHGAVPRFLVNSTAARAFYNSASDDLSLVGNVATLESRLFGSPDLYRVEFISTGLSTGVHVTIAAHTQLDAAPLTLLRFPTADALREFQKKGALWERVDPDGDLHVPLLTLQTEVEPLVLASMGGAEPRLIEARALRLGDVAKFLEGVAAVGVRLRRGASVDDFVWSARHGLRLRNLAVVETGNGADVIAPRVCAAIHAIVRGEFGKDKARKAFMAAVEGSTTYADLARTIRAIVGFTGTGTPGRSPRFVPMSFTRFAATHEAFVRDAIKGPAMGEYLANIAEYMPDRIEAWLLHNLAEYVGVETATAGAHTVQHARHLHFYGLPVTIHKFSVPKDAATFLAAASWWKDIDPDAELHEPLYTVDGWESDEAGVATLVGARYGVQLPQLSRRTPQLARATMGLCWAWHRFWATGQRLLGPDAPLLNRLSFDDLRYDGDTIRVSNLQTDSSSDEQRERLVHALVRDIELMYADDTFPLRTVDSSRGAEATVPVALTAGVRSRRDAFLARVRSIRTHEDLEPVLAAISKRVYQPWTATELPDDAPTATELLGDSTGKVVRGAVAAVGLALVAYRVHKLRLREQISTVRLGTQVLDSIVTETWRMPNFQKHCFYYKCEPTTDGWKCRTGTLSLQQALHVVYRPPFLTTRQTSLSSLAVALAPLLFKCAFSRLQSQKRGVFIIPTAVTLSETESPVIKQDMIHAYAHAKCIVAHIHFSYQGALHACICLFDMVQKYVLYVDSGYLSMPEPVERQFQEVLQQLAATTSTPVLQVRCISEDVFGFQSHRRVQRVAERTMTGSSILARRDACEYWSMLWAYYRCVYPDTVDSSAVWRRAAQELTGLNILTPHVASFMLIQFMLQVLMSCPMEEAPVRVGGTITSHTSTGSVYVDVPLGRIINDGPTHVEVGDVTVQQYLRAVGDVQAEAESILIFCRTLKSRPQTLATLVVDKPTIVYPDTCLHNIYFAVVQYDGYVNAYLVQPDVKVAAVPSHLLPSIAFLSCLLQESRVRVYTQDLVCVGICQFATEPQMTVHHSESRDAMIRCINMVLAV